MGSVGGIIDNTLGSNIFGDNSTDKAIKSQTQGTNQANQVLNQSFQDQKGYLTPYANAGADALTQIAGGNILDPSSITSDPGYQFRLAEGNKAINNSMAAQGLGQSGAAAKALTQYGSNIASDEYDKAYNREYNRLYQIAGYGMESSNNLANAAGAYGANVANNYMGLGNANASANIAQANRQSQLIGQGVGAAALAFSDERLKKNLVPVSKEELDELRKDLKAFHFEYKDELHGTGRWIGIKAQDLEKSKLGKTIVVENEKGEKMIDVAKVMSVFLATMAEAA